MSKEAFVYKWTEQATDMWYIGYHKGTIDDGYICSSETVKPMIKSNPEAWHREILAYGTRAEMMDLETDLLVKEDARNNPMSYNRSNGFGGFNAPQPFSVKVIGYNTQQYSVPVELEGALTKALGQSFYKQIMFNFANAIKSQDSFLTKHYIPMIEKLFGYKLEMKYV